MTIKLKVDENNLKKMIKGEEFNAYFSEDNTVNLTNHNMLTQINVLAENIKEVYKNYVVIKERQY